MNAVEILLLRTSLVDELRSGAPEAARFLSAEGRRLVRAIGNKLKLEAGMDGPGGRFEGSFDRFVAAPAPSSVQTAELFADRVDYLGVVEILPSLVAGAPAHVAATALLARGTSLAVVADEPAISDLGAFLIGRPTFPQLRPAQVSVIRDRAPAWCLRPGESVRALLLVA